MPPCLSTRLSRALLAVVVAALLLPAAASAQFDTSTVLGAVKDSSGGVINQSQTLQGPEAVPGYVTIVVAPQEDEAAAFNPGELEARLGFSSVWRAALMEIFPWLYGVFLTLR